MISREELIEVYANSIVDGMDRKSMEQFIYDVITENLENRTNREIAEEVFEYDETLFEIDPNKPLSKDQVVRKFVQINSESYPD